MVTRRLLLAGATVLAATPTFAFRPAAAAETGTVKTVTIVSRPDGTTSEQFVQRDCKPNTPRWQINSPVNAG